MHSGSGFSDPMSSSLGGNQTMIRQQQTVFHQDEEKKKQVNVQVEK